MTGDDVAGIIPLLIIGAVLVLLLRRRAAKVQAANADAEARAASSSAVDLGGVVVNLTLDGSFIEAAKRLGDGSVRSTGQVVDLDSRRRPGMLPAGRNADDVETLLCPRCGLLMAGVEGQPCRACGYGATVGTGSTAWADEPW